jgi:hypothetical protein
LLAGAQIPIFSVGELYSDEFDEQARSSTTIGAKRSHNNNAVGIHPIWKR